MTTGTTDFTIKSGFRTPIVEIPIPLLAVPYAAPKSRKGINIEKFLRDYSGLSDMQK